MRVPIGDLPRHYRHAAADFHDGEGYLEADPELMKVWARRLAELGGVIKVGISWRGGRQKSTQQARSIPLKAFTPVLSLPNAVFINLQYGDCRKDLLELPKQLRSKMISFEEVDPLTDLEPFFALIANLDLVISVDNSTVHFSGALGVPTWLLLPALADWRWPVEGEDSRWYSSVQLFRQRHEELGGWGAVIDCVTQQLAEKQPVPAKLPSRRSRLVATEEKQMAEPLSGRALLINDTSFWYHWGCSCTSLAIRDNLREKGFSIAGVPIGDLQGTEPIPVDFDQWNEELIAHFLKTKKELCEKVEAADVLIINGEGSLHGFSPLSASLLCLMYVAKHRFGKPVHVINHSCYPDDKAEPTGSIIEELYMSVYKTLDRVVVREPVSGNLLERLGLDVVRSFDSLPLFVDKYRDQIEHKASGGIIFSGSVAFSNEMLQSFCRVVTAVAGGQCSYLFGANSFPAKDDIFVIQQLQKLLPNGVKLLHARSEVEWLSIISSADLLVSGRFHHSIAAACLGTPFVVMDSNTPKISGLMQQLELQTYVNTKEAGFGDKLVSLADDLIRCPDKGLLTSENQKKINALAKKNFSFTDN